MTRMRIDGLRALSGPYPINAAHYSEWVIWFKHFVLLGFICVVPTAAFCNEKPSISIVSPYIGRINEPFETQISLDPPSSEPVNVRMEVRSGIRFSETSFRLQGMQQKFLTVTIKSAPPSGLAYIYADADGYDEGWSAIDIGFDGHLKPSWSEPLTSDTATTMSLAIVDRDGKPIPFQGELQLSLETADGVLNGSSGSTPTTLKIPAGSRASPQFQLKPRFARGGNVHLTAILTVTGYSHVLAQDQFVFPAQPAMWVPVLLALFGGLLHAIYKLVRMPADQVISLHAAALIVLTSLVAASVGYLFADFDLLGLKLDPNVLRTYPIVGFLFSYLGIEGLLSDRLSHIGRGTDQSQSSADTGASKTGDTQSKEQVDSGSGADATRIGTGTGH